MLAITYLRGSGSRQTVYKSVDKLEMIDNIYEDLWGQDNVIALRFEDIKAYEAHSCYYDCSDDELDESELATKKAELKAIEAVDPCQPFYLLWHDDRLSARETFEAIQETDTDNLLAWLFEAVTYDYREAKIIEVDND